MQTHFFTENLRHFYNIKTSEENQQYIRSSYKSAIFHICVKNRCHDCLQLKADIAMDILTMHFITLYNILYKKGYG